MNVLTLELEMLDTKLLERQKFPPRAKSRAAWASLKSPLLGQTPRGMLQVTAELRGRSDYRLATLGELKRNYRINKLQDTTEGK